MDPWELIGRLNETLKKIKESAKLTEIHELTQSSLMEIEQLIEERRNDIDGFRDLDD